MKFRNDKKYIGVEKSGEKVLGIASLIQSGVHDDWRHETSNLSVLIFFDDKR